MGEFHCGVTWTRYRCGMNRADQSSAWTNTNADRSLEILEERQAELLRLRDEVKQLSCKLQQFPASFSSLMSRSLSRPKNVVSGNDTK